MLGRDTVIIRSLGKSPDLTHLAPHSPVATTEPGGMYGGMQAASEESDTKYSAIGTATPRLPMTILVTLRDEHKAQARLPMIFDPGADRSEHAPVVPETPQTTAVVVKPRLPRGSERIARRLSAKRLSDGRIAADHSAVRCSWPEEMLFGRSAKRGCRPWR